MNVTCAADKSVKGLEGEVEVNSGNVRGIVVLEGPSCEVLANRASWFRYFRMKLRYLRETGPAERVWAQGGLHRTANIRESSMLCQLYVMYIPIKVIISQKQLIFLAQKKQNNVILIDVYMPLTYSEITSKTTMVPK